MYVFLLSLYAAEDNREASCVADVLFTASPSSAAHQNVYQRFGLRPDRTSSIHLNVIYFLIISPTPQFLQGQNVRNLSSNFRLHSPLSYPRLRTVQDV